MAKDCLEIVDDEFPGTTLDATKWSLPSGTDGVTVSDQLRLTANATANTGQADVLSLAAQKLAGTQLMAQFTSGATASVGGNDGFEWYRGQGEYIGIEVESGQLVASYSSGSGEQRACSDACPAYDPATHRFARMRADARYVYFEWSKTGIDWKPLGKTTYLDAGYSAHVFSYPPVNGSSSFAVDQISWRLCGGDGSN